MTQPLRITAIEIDGTVTRPLRFTGSPGEALATALREAMLKRGCLRDRAHKGQCLNCALLPQCAVWPLIAPADPTKRQRGPFLRPFVLHVPSIPANSVPVSARMTYGMTLVQDATFPDLWIAFADAFVQAARQIAEWGFGPAVREGEHAARRGAISVGRVRWVNPVTGETEPYTPTNTPPLVVEFHERGVAESSNEMRLTFLTPTRLVAAGETLRKPDPAVLIRRIAERLDTVAEAVGATKPDMLSDPALLRAQNGLRIGNDVTSWVGDAARGGFVGAVTLTGTPDDLAAVSPLLHWGVALGVGKGTLHGAGRFVVGAVPSTAVVEMPTRRKT